MVKTLRTATILLLASPLLTQCVPSQDVNSLDLRIRNLDNQVFQLGKSVNQMSGGADNPLAQIQAKQADLADNIDRLNSEIMQIKGKLEENTHRSRTSQSESDMSKSALQRKVDELSVQFAALSDQVNQNTSALKSGGVPASQHAAPPAKGAAATAESAETEKGAAADTDKAETKQAGAGQGKPAKAEEGKKTQEDTEAASPGDPGKAIYDKGLELFRASKFNEAYRTFSDYISKHPKGKMAPNARFWLGDCYYNQQEYELAILEYQKVIADYPSDGKAPSALLKQGLAFEKLKDNETAKIVYNKLLKEYPKSDQVETAKKRLDSLMK